MVEASNYQMAIDLLCCHLGISEEEAKQQLGITSEHASQAHVAEMQQAMLGLTNEK
ncbi:hypothetical protein [Vibrio atypicus]|uniref:hypothetical protein n=1 Tax=Vibrio atypicus TaxID=558271 RepID=UPI003735AEC3